MSAYSSRILSEAGLIAYWRLGETTGTSAADSKGTNPGTYTGGYTFRQTGGVNDTDTAVLLNGTTGFVSVPTSTSLDTGDVVTMEAWVKRGATLGTNQGIICRGSGAYYMRIEAADRLYLGKSQTADILTGTITIGNDGLFHHCVATKNGGTSHLYVDGVLNDGTFVDAVLGTSTAILALGAGNAGLSEFFTGTIDECAVYNVALTPEQVTAHYMMGRGASFPFWQPAFQVGP